MAVSVGLIAQFIEQFAPKYWAEQWDNVGLLVGSQAQQVNRVLIALDGTPEVVEEAKSVGAELIVAHHPLMFKPLKNLRFDNVHAQIPLELIRNNIAYYAAHTNLDQSQLSSAYVFADVLGLVECEFLVETATDPLVKIAVFVPQDSVEKVRQALVNVGVGESITQGPHSDNYAECFFQASGQGMFRPLSGADPTIGNIGELTRVDEIKLESVLPERLIARALKALFKAHPYEEPAFDLIPLKNPGKSRGYGVIGKLSTTQPLGQLWQMFSDALAQNDGRSKKIFPHNYSIAHLRVAGDPEKPIRKVAIANGSGGSFVPKALAKGVDLFITGDVDYHAVLDALQGGMAVGEIGHFLSEAPMLNLLAQNLKQQKGLEELEVIISKTNRVPWEG